MKLQKLQALIKSVFDVREYFINCLTSSFTYQLPAFPGGLSLIGQHKYSTVLGLGSGALGHCDVQLRVTDGGSIPL